MTDTVPEAPAAPRGWDPLAADPSGWDLPEAPSAPEPPRYVPPVPAPRRRKSKVGSATFGLAVLTAGAGVLANLNGIDWFSAQHIVGLVLGVTGLGLVVGAFAGGGRGLIGMAIPLSIVGLLMTTVPMQNFDFRGGVGEIKATPHSLADLKPEYRHAAGDIDLDLTALPAGAPITTTVFNGAGNTKIIVPAKADVTFDCHNGAGQTTCFDKSTSGVDQETVSGTDYGTDGPGGQQIILHVTNGAGNVEVRRD